MVGLRDKVHPVVLKAIQTRGIEKGQRIRPFLPNAAWTQWPTQSTQLFSHTEFKKSEAFRKLFSIPVRDMVIYII